MKYLVFRYILIILLIDPIYSLGVNDRPVSPENEQFIRELFDAIGVGDKLIFIKKFDKDDVKKMGWDNAYIVCYGRDTYNLFVSEQWFNLLTEKEKKFLVAHEAMHIKLGHLKVPLDKNNKEDLVIMRKHEQEADKEAVAFLGCSSGALSWLSLMRSGRAESLSVPLIRLLVWVKNFLGSTSCWPFDSTSTHPSFSERIILLDP